MLDLQPGAIDAHAHVFTTELPLDRDGRYLPHQDAPTDAYLALLDRHEMAAAILVQPSFLGTDNDYMLAAVARAPTRFRAVAVVPPSVAKPELERLAARGTVGIRLNLLGEPVPPLTKPPWPGLLDALVALGLFVEVQAEGRQWEVLLPALLGAGATVVIDHFGRPQGNDAPSCAGLGAVLAAVAEPNVWVKLSGPYRFPACPRMVFMHLLERAGPDRFLWGSDWPWTQHPEITDYVATHRWLDAWTPDSDIRSRILTRNPRRLLGLPERPDTP